MRWDGGAYYILGTSMTQGHGYRLLSEPGSPNTPLHSPLLPMFIAAHQLILGTTDPLIVGRALRVSACLLFGLQAAAIYILLRAFLAQAAALLGVIFWIWNPVNTFYSDRLLTESLFGLITIVFFILHRRTSERRYFLLAAACAVLAFLARTTGMLLFAAWAGERLLKRDYKQAAVIIAMATVLAGLWVGYIRHVESSPQYVRPAYAYQHADYTYFNISYGRQILRLKDPFVPELGYLTPYSFAKRFLANAWEVKLQIGQSIFSWTYRLHWPYGPDISPLVALLVFVGLLVQVARRHYVIPIFVVLNVIAICMTPFLREFSRYMLPIAPLITLSFFEALRWLNAYTRKHQIHVLSTATLFLTVALLAVMAAQEIRQERDLYRHHDGIDYLHDRGRVSYRVFYYSPDDRETDQGIDWLRSQAGRDDVVAATDPQWVYLRTGLKSVMPPLELNSAAAERLIDTVPVRYIFLDENIYRENMYRRYTSSLITGNPNLWKCVWRGPEDRVRIYERSDSR